MHLPDIVSTHQVLDGGILNAVGELLTHCTHNATAPRNRHLDTEYMVRDSVAFYGREMLMVESEKKSSCQVGDSRFEKRKSPPARAGAAKRQRFDLKRSARN
jgi:hypothetical protein